MNIQQIKSHFRTWAESRKTFGLSYYFFSCIIAFALYEGIYFYSFPTTEFLEFVFATLCLAFLGGFLALSNKKPIKFLGVSFFFVTIGLYLFYSGHHLIFGTPPTSNVYVSLFETNSSETLEFLESYTNFGLFIKLLLPVILSIPLYVFLRLAHPKIHRKYLGLSIFFSLAAIASVSNLKYKSPYRFVNQYLIYQKERATFRNTFSAKPPADLTITQNNSLKDDTVILVIGESTSRNRMSLYGYHRQTSPELEKLKEDLFIYKNIISANSHTVPSLEKALTFLNSENEGKISKNANIIQLARLAGYKSFWLSNQPPLGKDETPLNIMANNADQTFWISDSPSFRYNSNVDGNLLPVLEKVLEKPGKKFVVLHLMGSHTTYKHRYLQSFNKFQESFKHKIKLSKEQWNDYNNYDNSILYNDFVVSSIIHQAKAVPNATVVYFSDHGEEVYDNRYVKGHTEALKSNLMFEVPYITYTNQTTLAQKLKSHIKDRESALWSIEDFIHTLHDLFGIETTYYEAKRSLLSDKFEAIPRMAAGEYYEAGGPEVTCAAKGMFTPEDKIWVHRVNTKERLEILLKDFAGFEIDVMWNPLGKFFDVYHPPVESINLNLESMFAIDKSGKKYFWLDLKNLSESNVADVLNELNRLDQKFKLKNRILVESDQAPILESISKAGFFTSYYIPAFRNIKAGAYVSQVSPKIQNYHSALSQTGTMIEFMDAKFSGCDKLLWILKDNRDNRNKIDELKERDDIKVILVSKKTKFRR